MCVVTDIGDNFDVLEQCFFMFLSNAALIIGKLTYQKKKLYEKCMSQVVLLFLFFHSS